MNDRYGMNINGPSDAKTVAQTAALNVGWVRFEINWPDVQPDKKTTWNWKPFDDFIKILEARKLKILGSLSYAPAWASGNKTTTKAPPINGSDYRDFVTQVVKRYRGRITHWGLWNEPNLTQFFKGSRRDYVEKVMLPGVEGVRSADPTAKLVGPDLSYQDNPRKQEHWYAWLKAMLAAKQDAFDIMSVHIYKEPKSPELWRHMDGTKAPLVEGPNVKDAFAGLWARPLPVWITEIGWKSEKVGEEKQKQFYEQFFTGIATRWSWVEKVFFYSIRDGGQSFGLTKNDTSPKRAFAVVSAKLAAGVALGSAVTGTAAGGVPEPSGTKSTRTRRTRTSRKAGDRQLKSGARASGGRRGKKTP